MILEKAEQHGSTEYTEVREYLIWTMFCDSICDACLELMMMISELVHYLSNLRFK